MAAGPPAHAGPWSRRSRPPRRATAHLNSQPCRRRPTQAFYSSGPPRPQPRRVCISKRGEPPGRESKGETRRGRGVQKETNCRPKREVDAGAKGGGGRGGRILSEHRGIARCGTLLRGPSLTARTPRPPRNPLLQVERRDPWGSGAPGQRHAATPGLWRSPQGPVGGEGEETLTSNRVPVFKVAGP